MDFETMVRRGIEKKVKAKLHKFLFDVYSNTPKNSGLLAGNWQIAEIPTSTNVAIRGVEEVLQGINALNFTTHIPNIYVYNNIHYVGYVEHGTIKMTGYFMLQKAIAANF